MSTAHAPKRRKRAGLLNQNWRDLICACEKFNQPMLQVGGVKKAASHRVDYDTAWERPIFWHIDPYDDSETVGCPINNNWEELLAKWEAKNVE